MGFHPLDLLVVVVVGLLIFGPTKLQSMARGAGRLSRQAKEAKDKLMSELPMEDFTNASRALPRIPASPQQAARMLLAPDKPEHTTPAQDEKVVVETPAPQQQG